MGINEQEKEKRPNAKIALGFPYSLPSFKKRFRHIDRSIYPSIKGYTEDQLYDNGKWLSPGGYLMLHIVAEQLNLKKGTRILDLGCGNGQSSIYFAKEFDADVVAIDLWIDAESRNKRAQKEGVINRVKNIKADLSKGLKGLEGKFDYIISVQAFHCFGDNGVLMADLTKLLDTNGKIGIIQSTFNKKATLPGLFLKSDGWETNYSTYYYPDWWKQHFKKYKFQVLACFELPQGKQIWEDNILYFGNRNKWAYNYFKSHGWLMGHVLYNINDFYLTHFLLTASLDKQKTPVFSK